MVAAARRQLEYAYYALRDHHVSTDLRTPAARPPVPIASMAPDPQGLAS